jgi:transposase
MGDHRTVAAEQATWRAAAGRSPGAERDFLTLRTGSPWRDLAERYGPYTTVYNRYNRWAKAGVWLRVFEVLAEASPASLHLIDSSIVRAHQHAAGGKKGARITPSAVLVED